MKPSVAFATYNQLPELSEDDRLVAEELRRRSIQVHAAVWDAADVDWAGFDRIIIRSVWDYHLKPRAYQMWLQGFLAEPERLSNPPAAVLANLNKRYLMDLAARGHNVIRTVYVPAGRRQSLHTIIESHQWDEVVIKPAVSASAFGTWRSSLADAKRHQDQFASQTQTQDILVQEYFPEIASAGEWSLIFFDGQFSHSVLKKPAEGDFRVQRHLGGTTIAARPAEQLIHQASEILRKLGFPLLYARVDGIERDGQFVLMELEINEPLLFLGYSENAPRRFADSIARILPESHGPRL